MHLLTKKTINSTRLITINYTGLAFPRTAPVEMATAVTLTTAFARLQ